MGKLTRFFGNWITALKAFPVSHLILVFLTIYGFYLVDSHQADQERKLMIAGAFGLLISFVGPLIALHYEGSEKKIRLLNYGFQGLALVGI